MFEVAEADYPNPVTPADKLNHYLWAYMIGPMAGGAIGGLLSIIHAKCAAKKGSDNNTE